ncbi:MAG: flagellar basal body protein FliL [Sulfurospirillum sp.]|nr:MAG: flagellar basal body protein FliL [Sulfurospirillum sp.]
MAEATEKSEAVVEKKSGGANVLLIVIATMLGLMLIGGGVGAYLLLSEDDAVIADANSAKATQTQKEETVTPTQAPAKSVRKSDFTNIGPMYPLDQFIVNLFSEDGSRYLKTTINLEMSLEELATELDAKKPLIRDIIIKALSAKSYEEISTIAGKENLKDEIVANVNAVLKDGKINNVFFTDFVIQ